jgi:type VI secretion system protein ImpH
MAEADRTASHALALMQSLGRKPFEFGFFQALRRLENAFPEKPRIGHSRHAAEDPVRLAQEPSMRFAPATLASFTPGEQGRPARLASYFFGLLGPNGPLPLHLTEHAQDRLRHEGDPTFARFLDLFHHRMLALFYRAWAVNQPTVSFDRPAEDHFAAHLAALFGFGMPSLRDRDAFPDLARLHYAGLFACQTRPPEGLRAILAGFFRVPVAIHEFIGGWLDLPATQRWRLGDSRQSGELGRNVAVGRRVWGCQHKIRIVLGPLDLADYRRLLPGGDSLRRLVPLVRSYVGDGLAWELNLVLKQAEIPRLQLDRGLRLGWTTWAPRASARHDAADLRLEPLEGVA